uniref:Uncharacterized protein n=1 Tax=Mesocestoides corti TaxID=53468 RepID=A0A5K3G3M1_MESCO
MSVALVAPTPVEHLRFQTIRAKVRHHKTWTSDTTSELTDTSFINCLKFPPVLCSACQSQFWCPTSSFALALESDAFCTSDVTQIPPCCHYLRPHTHRLVVALRARDLTQTHTTTRRTQHSISLSPCVLKGLSTVFVDFQRQLGLTAALVLLGHAGRSCQSRFASDDCCTPHTAGRPIKLLPEQQHGLSHSRAESHSRWSRGIGYPVVTLGFGLKSLLSHHLRLRRQHYVKTQNSKYFCLLELALPEEARSLYRRGTSVLHRHISPAWVMSGEASLRHSPRQSCDVASSKHLDGGLWGLPN